MFAASAARATVPRLATAVARPAVLSSRAATASFAQHPTPRTYATEAKPVDSKPPIPLFGVDGTYASALYTAAAKTSTLDTTATALSRLHSTFAKDPKLQTIMQAPTLTAEDKNAVITELLKASQISESSKEGATVRNFLHTLADNNRLSLLDSACVKFEQLMSASRGEIELTVTSAEELDRKVLQRLEAAVSKSRFVGQGHKLKVVSKVQPDIRGGLIVEIGDRTIDLSVSGKMARMNKLLKDTL